MKSPIQKQAHKQAPWRVQAQRFGAVALGLVGFAIIAFLYLSISAQIATAGIQVQNLDYGRTELKRENADLLTKWAYFTSAAVMEKRAQDMGYELIDPLNVTYMVVEGYAGKELPEIEEAPFTSLDIPSLIKPGYAESLSDWFNTTILIPSKEINGAEK